MSIPLDIVNPTSFLTDNLDKITKNSSNSENLLDIFFIRFGKLQSENFFDRQLLIRALASFKTLTNNAFKLPVNKLLITYLPI